nr:MAG TPA: hypothetical protein [Caudoviricetes sp.]
MKSSPSPSKLRLRGEKLNVVMRATVKKTFCIYHLI